MRKNEFRITKTVHNNGKRWTVIAATALTVIGTGTAIVHADEQQTTSSTPEITNGSEAALAGSQVTLSAPTSQSSAVSVESQVASISTASSASQPASVSTSSSATQTPPSATVPNTFDFLATDDSKKTGTTSSTSNIANSSATSEQATTANASNAGEVVANNTQSAVPNSVKPEPGVTSPLTEITDLGEADDIVTDTAKLVAGVIYQQTGLPQKITRVGVPLVASGTAVVPPTDTTTNTVTFANPPSYKAYAWLDPDSNHFTFSQTAINDGGLIVVSTDRTGNGTVYVHELSPKTYHDDVTYTVKAGQSVTSAKYGFTYNNQNYGLTLLNGQHYSTFMITNSDGVNRESDHVMWVPRLVNVTTNFVNESGQAIKPKSVQQGLSWQQYTDKPPMISGYTLDTTKLPKVQSGQLSLFGKGWSGTLDYGSGVSATYVQLTDEGDVDVTVTDEHLFDNTKTKTPTTTQVFHLKAGDYTWQIYNYKDINGAGGQIAIENPAYGAPAVVTYVYFSNYSIKNHKTVNETINYVDEQGTVVAPQKKATAIDFLTVHDSSTNKDTVYYSTTQSAATATIDPATGKPVGDGWQSDGASFAAVPDPTVTGYYVLSTNALHSGLTETAAQNVDSTSSDLVYKVVYAKAAVTPPSTPKTPETPFTPQHPETPVPFFVNTPTPIEPVNPVPNNVTPKIPSVLTPLTFNTPSVPSNPVASTPGKIVPQQQSIMPKPISNVPDNIFPVFGPIAVSNVSEMASVHSARAPRKTVSVVSAKVPQKLQHAARLPHTDEQRETGLVALGLTLLSVMGLTAGYRRRH